MHVIYTDMYLYISMHFWNDSKDICWLTCYEIYFQEEELFLRDTARSKWYHLNAQRETNIVTNQLSAVLHTSIHTALLFKLVLRKIQQFSNYLKKSLCTVKLPCRSYSAGWSHRLVWLLHPIRLKLEYGNKGVDHHTPAKCAGFKNTDGWTKINFNSFLTQFLRWKQSFYLCQILKDLILLQNDNISSFKHNNIFFSITLS